MQYVDGKIDEFLSQMKETLASMTEEEFENLVTILFLATQYERKEMGRLYD